MLPMWTTRAPSTNPAGIEVVVVNGAIVVEDGAHTGARPGRLLTNARVVSRPG
jgi:N-acyl-D-amino-acid deacylase